MKRMDYCVDKFDYLGNRVACIRQFTGALPTRADTTFRSCVLKHFSLLDLFKEGVSTVDIEGLCSSAHIFTPTLVSSVVPGNMHQSVGIYVWARGGVHTTFSIRVL